MTTIRCTSADDNFNLDFDSETWRSLMSVPLDTYAGRDLTQVELEAHAAIQKKRDEMTALRAAAAATATMTRTTMATTTTTAIMNTTEPETISSLPSSPGPIDAQLASVTESLTVTTLSIAVPAPHTTVPATSDSGTDDEDDDAKAETAPTSPVAASPIVTNGIHGDVHQDGETSNSPTAVPTGHPAFVAEGDVDDARSVLSAGHDAPHSPLSPVSPMYMPSVPYVPAVVFQACEGCKVRPTSLMLQSRFTLTLFKDIATQSTDLHLYAP